MTQNETVKRSVHLETIKICYTDLVEQFHLENGEMSEARKKCYSEILQGPRVKITEEEKDSCTKRMNKKKGPIEIMREKKV